MIPSPQRARRRAAPAPFRRPPSTAPSSGTGTVIPYDYAATFELTGQPGNLVQDVINISQEGVFVAVAIGYGFEADRGRTIELLPPPGQTTFPDTLLPGAITLGQLPTEALIEGFRVNPRLEPIVLRTGQDTGRAAGAAALSDQPLSATFSGTLLQKIKASEEISFLFSLVDTASGRELQDEPTHNLASLGISNGERPFRLLAQPLSFLPRSTLRLQVIERSQDTRGTLFIVLYGYKIFAAAGCPEPLVRTLRGPFICPTESIGNPSDRVIPFDYVASVQLTGRPGNLLDTEVPINVEGGFVSTAIGYGLAADERNVQIQATATSGYVLSFRSVDEELPDTGRNLVIVALVRTDRDLLHIRIFDGNEKMVVDKTEDQLISGKTLTLLKDLLDPLPDVSSLSQEQKKKIIRDATSIAGHTLTRTLADLKLQDFPPNALRDGIRIRPNFVRIAFQNNGGLNNAISPDLANQIFESLNRPEDVSFRYTIFDGGSGRELQNQPLNNIAGLGIATGERPFKKFARPMIFLPRSTIRVTVEERFGRGRLFFVFQGYKVLSARLSSGGRR